MSDDSTQSDGLDSTYVIAGIAADGRVDADPHDPVDNAARAN